MSSAVYDDEDTAPDTPLDPELTMRRFRDNVHEYIPVSQRVCNIIDTEHFQRLKKIKQLGTSYYVWPGASHNRFEHCLGVAHLAREMATHLQRRQPELNITDRDVECVQIAGLCHDLGHGPWSHVWDSMFIPHALKDEKWQHEDASEMMFDALVASKPSVDLTPKDIRFVKALIAGDPAKADADEKRFLFDIVANKRNGIDVDKCDYIARDYRSIGEQTNISFLRLIHSARVIGDEICYNHKDVNLVYGLCQTRFWLHKTYYSHKTARAVEYMIIDALLAAEPHMQIARRIRDPKKFLYLTDSIMDRIQESEEPELEEARAIFRRLTRRELYRLVDTTLIEYDARHTLADAVTPEAIVTAVKERFASATDTDLPDVDPALVAALEPRHVIVDVTVMHYGMKAANPLSTVRFYSKTHPNKAVAVDKAHFSTSLPARFAEANLRVYTRDESFFGLIQAGYRAVLARIPGFAPEGAEEVPVGARTPSVEDDTTAGGGGHATSRTAPLASIPSLGVVSAVPGTPPAQPGTLPVHTPSGSVGGGTPKFMVNPLTTVPANYTPASPPRRPSGAGKRVRSPSNSSARETKRRG